MAILWYFLGLFPGVTSQVCIGVISPGSCHLQHEEHVGAGGVVYRQEPGEHLRLGIPCLRIELS